MCHYLSNNPGYHYMIRKIILSECHEFVIHHELLYRNKMFAGILKVCLIPVAQATIFIVLMPESNEFRMLCLPIFQFSLCCIEVTKIPGKLIIVISFSRPCKYCKIDAFKKIIYTSSIKSEVVLLIYPVKSS